MVTRFHMNRKFQLKFGPGNRTPLIVIIIGTTVLLVALLDFWTSIELVGSILFTFPLNLCAAQSSKWLLWGTVTTVARLIMAAEFWVFNRAERLHPPTSTMICTSCESSISSRCLAATKFNFSDARVIASSRYDYKMLKGAGDSGDDVRELSNRMSGFSLIETLILLSLIMITSGIFFMSLQPALKDTRVTNGYNTTLMTLRRAREAAIAERRVYVITFNNTVTPNTITITRAATGLVISVQVLPNDIVFKTLPGLPNSVATSPDHFGTGGIAVDFDQGVSGGAKNIICFNPDGSAQDVNSNSNNGVVYLARSADLYSSRAITLWGSTGRLRGYRLYPNMTGGAIWRQQ
jgi:Tfp pilus assembly protein FimT